MSGWLSHPSGTKENRPVQVVADPRRDGTAHAIGGTRGEGASEALAFYRRQSRITDPGPHAVLLDDLPRDVPALCRVVRGIVLHPATAHLYHVTVPPERLGEQDTRHVGAILDR